MTLSRRAFYIVAAVAMFFTGPLSAHELPAKHDVHRVVIQVSDNEPSTFTKVLNNVTNMSQYFLDRGEEYEIEIVAYNAGLHMLRADTSPVLKRVQSITNGVPNLTLSACGNTMKGMGKKEGKEIQLVSNARVVPGGIIRLMELSDQGYFMIRP